MKLLTARVLDGHLDIPEGCLQEGELTPEERERLLESIAQADRGEAVDGWQLLGELED